jgi:hypothetical protein
MEDFSSLKDCFLGIVSCIIRFFKAIFFNIIYMTRLDYSILGRPIEKLGKCAIFLRLYHSSLNDVIDFGFAAYVAYLHVEVIHTNPIVIGTFLIETTSVCSFIS